MLTQHPESDYIIKISPLVQEDATSVENQKLEGIEEIDIINYT